MTSLNEAFAPPSAEELVRAAQDYSGSAQGSASDDLVAPPCRRARLRPTSVTPTSGSRPRPGAMRTRAGRRWASLPATIHRARASSSSPAPSGATRTASCAGAGDRGSPLAPFQETARCDNPEAEGVAAIVTPLSPAVDAEDW
jgi:hypothetical protein